ncbi:gliding motility-associated C-terminal domain-containing protein [Tannerella forsythia]|nr:gliding motility-associated C-terminal domain-containing protein [Tannerella forsythia]
MFRIIVSCMLALMLSEAKLWAQYQVDGGTKKPLKVVENTAYKLQVYLVHGMEGVTISYTSASASHRWYRYKTKAAVEDEWEAVPSTQNGTTSTVTNLTEGYGYFVNDGGMKHYIWLIDYSKYPFNISLLKIGESSDRCSGLRLDGSADMPALKYFLPDGKEMEVKREFEVSYLTQTWSKSGKRFIEELAIDTLRGNPFATQIRPPLRDTKIELTGDLFARHFGVEQSAAIDLFETVAIEVHADTLVSSESKTNLSRKKGELLAPAHVHFKAYANTPVASLFVWQIVKKEPTGDRPLVRFTEAEMDYTFDTAGEYKVTLEVSDRSGKCTHNETSYNIHITETIVKVPNVFTPGDSPGVNDIFKVVHKSVVRFRAWIFNRWGNELYHWTDPNEGWDGKYRGKYVPAGAYYYVIEYTGTDGKTHKLSGDINVVRSNRMNSQTP